MTLYAFLYRVQSAWNTEQRDYWMDTGSSTSSFGGLKWLTVRQTDTWTDSAINIHCQMEGGIKLLCFRTDKGHVVILNNMQAVGENHMYNKYKRS